MFWIWDEAKGMDINMNRKRYDKNKLIYLIITMAVFMILWKKSDYEKAKEYEKAYEAFWQEGLYKEDFYYPEEIRYEYVYIDEDDIPELLLADGNFHVSRIGLYVYNQELKKIEFLASFSTYGELEYVPKKNIINSYYGSHGYYHNVYSKKEGNKIELIDVFLSDGTKKEGKFYAGFPVDSEFTGGYGKPNSGEGIFDTLPEVTEEYKISEEAYHKLVDELEKGSIEISYEEMKEYG